MKKILMNNEPIVLENKNFQTIMIKVMFPFIETEETLAKEQLLPSMLNYMNNKYPTEEELSIEKRKLYILSSSCWKTTIGNVGCFSFNFIVPDTYALGSDMLDKQFEFFNNFIYNPLVIDNSFNEFELEREKRNIKTSMENALKRMESYQSIKLKQFVDDQGIYSRNLITNQGLIDKVTPQNLYKYYLDVIFNNQPVIYIFGNVNKNRINNLCHKYLFRKNFDKKYFNSQLYYYLKPRNKVLEIEEDSNFKDSAVSFVYKIKNPNEDDTYYLNLIRDLLNSLSSRLLNKKLRDENELVYSSFAVSYPHFGLLEITCYINKDNIDIVKEKVYEVMNDLKIKNNISKYLDNLKNRNRLNLIKRLDNKNILFNDFVISNLGIHESEEEYYKRIDKITDNEIVKFMDKLILDTVYFLREENHE